MKLIIEYDGGSYHGWQKQKNELTIQGEIEKALYKMTGKKANLIGSGRTDAGVHAYGQVANFGIDTKLSPEIIQRGLNSLLKESIVIKSCTRVNESFHARYDVKSKVYHYYILNSEIPSAIGRQYFWHISKSLKIIPMKESILSIIGLHDFKSFEGAGSPRAHTTRNVMKANIEKTSMGRLLFKIEADGFLRYMIRNLIGTLVDVGLSKITPDDFLIILNKKDRASAGRTAPPQGLFLMKVKY